jgi:hypothetical protein
MNADVLIHDMTHQVGERATHPIGRVQLLFLG